MAITKVSSGVISANAVTATIVAENVITSSEIATDGVGTLQIADDAVTSAKLDTNIDIAGTLDVTGVLTADSNVVIAGNLTVNGSTVTNSSTNTTIEDALIELGTGTTGTPANDAGIIIERGDSNNAFMGFDESEDKFIVATTTATGASTGDLTLTAAPLVTGDLTASGLSYPTSDGSANQVIKTDGSGNLSFVTAITDGAVVHNYTATGDGSTVTFDTGINPQDEVNTWVHIDGVYQNKSEYSYNGTEITFTSAPDSGAAIDVITGNQNGFSTADSVLGVYSTTTTDTATYDTGLSATNENNVNIFIEGVYQPKSTYTWSGSTITFDANTPTGLALEVIASKTLTSGAVVTASITDDAVTTAKIADNAITSAKIVNNSITGADISATTDIVANTFTGALTGDVTGNVTGNVTGTIQTAAQPNITSVGTLTGLDVDDVISIDTSTGAAFSSTGNLKIDIDSDDSQTDRTFQITSDGNSKILFQAEEGGDISFYEDTGTTAKLFWDASEERLGIGTSSPAYKLDLNGDMRFTTGSALFWADVNVYEGRTGNDRYWVTGGSQSMTLDSSGNLLVGNTDSTPYDRTSGNAIALGDGLISSAQEGGNAAIFNRMTSDGSIVNFRKNGSTVGSIGTDGNHTYFVGDNGSNGCGLLFGVNTATPVNRLGTPYNGFLSLGTASNKFKDLYLDGGAYLGGTGSANYLDDYEEGTWTVSLTPSASGSITINSGINTMKYTKVGRLVTITGRVNISSISSPTGGVRFNLPFTTSNTGQSNSNYAMFLVVTHGIDTTNTTQYVMAEAGNNTTQAEWREVTDNDDWPIFPATNLQGDGNEWFYINGSYTTA